MYIISSLMTYCALQLGYSPTVPLSIYNLPTPVKYCTDKATLCYVGKKQGQDSMDCVAKAIREMTEGGIR